MPIGYIHGTYIVKCANFCFPLGRSQFHVNHHHNTARAIHIAWFRSSPGMYGRKTLKTRFSAHTQLKHTQLWGGEAWNQRRTCTGIEALWSIEWRSQEADELISSVLQTKAQLGGASYAYYSLQMRANKLETATVQRPLACLAPP